MVLFGRKARIGEWWLTDEVENVQQGGDERLQTSNIVSPQHSNTQIGKSDASTWIRSPGIVKSLWRLRVPKRPTYLLIFIVMDLFVCRPAPHNVNTSITHSRWRFEIVAVRRAIIYKEKEKGAEASSSSSSSAAAEGPSRAPRNLWHRNEPLELNQLRDCF